VTGGVIAIALSTNLLTMPALSQQQPPPQEPAARFSSAVDLVSVSAVVRDRKGRFVRDLSREDFTILEAGQPKPIIDFRAEADGPIKVALLLDVSGSMRVGEKAVDAKQAAAHVFAGLTPDDRAAIFTFDTALRQTSEFTGDRQTLERAIDNADKPFGQTSLYDAIAEVSRATVSATTPTNVKLPHRTAVVVITDGIDTRSRLSPEQVSAIASSIDIPVYIVAVVAMVDDPREQETRPGDVTPVLQQLAQFTGGELFIASAPAHASVAARQILGELRHQYVLAFEASTRPGWRALQVRARDRNHVVRARSGYAAGGGRTGL
jgi:VWFA-related protein